MNQRFGGVSYERKKQTVRSYARHSNYRRGGGGDNDPPPEPTLSGDITLSPPGPVLTNTELTATYSGTEEVETYSWKKDGKGITITNNDGTINNKANKYTPTSAGSYTVTITAVCSDYKVRDKTSAPVIVTEPVWAAVTDTKFGDSNITAIAYGNGKFVAVGEGGKIAYSSDGITWTDDGITWTDVTETDPDNKLAGDINTIAYGNGKFVAGGKIGSGAFTMATSPDGITWTGVENTSIPTPNPEISTIFFGGSGSNGKFIAASGSYMATSTNGTTWTAVSDSTFGYSTIRSIAYGNGGSKFVAVGFGGKIAYSSDGVTWTEVSDSTFTSNIYAIGCTVSGKLIAGGENGKMATSTNGTTWTAVSDSPFGTSAILAIIADYAVGKDGKMATTNANGTTWTAVSDSTFGTSDWITGIAYGNNTYVAVGSNSMYGGKIAYKVLGH